MKFDVKNDTFKFGVIGLYGTNRESSFYKVIANVGGKKFLISKPDWPAITQTVWRLQADQDISVDASKLNLASYSSVVYEVHKFDFEKKILDEAFGYAV